MPTPRSSGAVPETQIMETSFHDALIKLALLVGAKQVNEAGTTISEFKAHYSAVLDRADAGALEVITRNKRRYVILGEAQITALATRAKSQCLAGDLLADLPRLPSTDSRPRVRSKNTINSGRLPE